MKPKHYLRIALIGLIIALIVFFIASSFTTSSAAFVVAIVVGTLGAFAVLFWAISRIFGKK